MTGCGEPVAGDTKDVQRIFSGGSSSGSLRIAIQGRIGMERIRIKNASAGDWWTRLNALPAARAGFRSPKYGLLGDARTVGVAEKQPTVTLGDWSATKRLPYVRCLRTIRLCSLGRCRSYGARHYL